MIRNLLFTFAVFFIANTTHSEESFQEEEEYVDHETMIWLEREGMADPAVPNSRVHRILSLALESDEEKVFNCAVGIVSMHLAVTAEGRVRGLEPRIERELHELPGLYDLLVDMWERGWKESGGVHPKIVAPPKEVFTEKTDCVSVPGNPSRMWASAPRMLAYIAPGDERVHEILWTHLPQVGAAAMLFALHEGKFNEPKDQQFRIDTLLNPEMGYYEASIAAIGLGEFPAAQGLETLV